jgi:hypothetical protein
MTLKTPRFDSLSFITFFLFLLLFVLISLTTESLAFQGGDGVEKPIRCVSYSVFWEVPWRANL